MFLLCALLLLWLVLPGQAAIRYVATSGNDGNSCPATLNSTSPRRTIAGGIACLSGGDMLLVAPGVYNEIIDGETVPSGTASAPTVLRSSTLRGAIVQPAFGTSYLASFGFNGANQHYITFDGFVLDGSNTGTSISGIRITGQTGSGDLLIVNNEIRNLKGTPTGMSTAFGIWYGWAPTGVVIRGNSLHDLGGGDTTSSDGWAYGIYLSSSGLVFENNEIYNTSGFAIHGYSGGGDVSNNIVRNNYIHDTGAALLMCHSNNQVYNNILRRVSAGGPACQANTAMCGGIMIGGACSGFAATGNRVYNNTIYQSQGNCIELSIPGGTNVSSTTVQNNICYQNSTDGVVENVGSGNTMDHNLLGTNPQFVTASPTAPTDFQLQSTSPAKDTGVSTAAYFTTDYGGQSRIQGGTQDLGAWEFSGTVTPPSPTPLVYWRLNEGTGTTAADATGNNHTLTWTTAPGPGWVAGKVGLRALGCDGSSSVATLTDDLPTTLYTWMFWLQGATAPGLSIDQLIFAKGGQFGFFWSSNDACCVLGASHTLGDGSFIVPPKLPSPLVANRWYHVTGTYDGSTVTLYLNGQAQASAPASSLRATSGPTTLCATSAVMQFDEVRVWNRALTATEVLAEYNKTKRTMPHHGGTAR